MQTKRETRFLKRHTKCVHKESLRSQNFYPPVQVPIIASKCRATPPPRTQLQHPSLFSSSPKACGAGGVFRSSVKKTPPSEPSGSTLVGAEENSGSVGGWPRRYEGWEIGQWKTFYGWHQITFLIFLFLFLFIPELSFPLRNGKELSLTGKITNGFMSWAKDIKPTCDWFGSYLHCTKRWGPPRGQTWLSWVCLEAKITWPLKRFCHQNQSQNYGEIWGPHKLYETMQNKQAWYFVGQNYYFFWKSTKAK